MSLLLLFSGISLAITQASAAAQANLRVAHAHKEVIVTKSCTITYSTTIMKPVCITTTMAPAEYTSYTNGAEYMWGGMGASADSYCWEGITSYLAHETISIVNPEPQWTQTCNEEHPPSSTPTVYPTITTPVESTGATQTSFRSQC